MIRAVERGVPDMEEGFFSQLVGLVRPRLWGLGFVWAWIYCAFSTSALYANRTGVSVNADASWLVSASCVCVCLFLFGWLLRGRDLSGRPALHIGAGVLTAVGTLLSVVPAPASAGEALVVVSGVLTGVGSALLIVLWCACLARVNIAEAEVAVCTAPVVLLVCAVAVPALSGAAGVVAVTGLPLVAGLLLAVSFPREQDSEALGRELSASVRSRSGLARSVGAIFATYVAIGFVAANSGPADALQAAVGIDLGTLVGTAAGIAFALLFVNYARQLDFTELFRWVTPLAVGSVALFAAGGPVAEPCGVALESLVDIAVQAVSVVCLVTLAKRGHADIFLAAGVSQGCLQLGVLAGNVLGARAGAAGDEAVLAGALAAICLVCVANALLPRPYAAARVRVAGDGAGAAGGVGTDGAGVGAANANAAAGALAAGGVGAGVVGGVADAPVATAASAAPATTGATAAFPLADGSVAAAASTLNVVPDAVSAVTPLSAASAFAASFAAPVAPVAPDLDATCARLAAERGLTQREAEVLAYLARGRSQPFIREELVLSKNTVASHVKHIYQKLGVHSRQELLDLFEAR